MLFYSRRVYHFDDMFASVKGVCSCLSAAAFVSLFGNFQLLQQINTAFEKENKEYLM